MSSSSETLVEEIQDPYNEDYNQQLRSRINQLRGTMQDLRVQLKDEKDNWEKEIQQINNLTTSNHKQSDSDISNRNSLHRLTSMYEDPVDYIHVESKNLQRQLAISNYRSRLLEVENLCNLELMRVKQNVTFLQPLRMMVSEWESSKQPNECGECFFPDQRSADTNLVDDHKLNDLSSLELIHNKFAGDMSTFSKLPIESKQITHLSGKLPYQNDDNRFNSNSSTWCSEYIVE